MAAVEPHPRPDEHGGRLRLRRQLQRVRLLPAGIEASLLALARVVVAAVRGRGVRRRLDAALRAGVPLRRLREALLQVVPAAGFGRAINAFWVLSSRVPSPCFSGFAPRDRRRTGEPVCRAVYGPAYRPLLRRMRSFHPDLARWIVEFGYGEVLARPGLSLRERELLNVAMLAAMGMPKQVESHVRGALRAGATSAGIKALLRGCGLGGRG